MKIDIGNHSINIDPVKNACNKCKHADWSNANMTGLPKCSLTGKSAMYERGQSGRCTRDGLNFNKI